MRELVIPAPYPPQVAFFKAESRYVAYGGARGGGKSWAARTKAVLLAMRYAGIQILLLRRTLGELRENHVLPLQKLLKGIAVYREQAKEFVFPSGSRLVLGYCSAERDVLQFQGQAYDVIFLEEATQFTEFQFQALTESNRASGQMRDTFSSRMYFTCNPGGVGHAWVKRLFIDRVYRGSERPEDYTFIPAKVYDNRFLMERDPAYVHTLENLPEKRRRAMLDGDWTVFEGQYFSEWDPAVHVVEPFVIPADWRRYFTMDYGLDMLAGYWIAMDPAGNAWVYREIYQSGLIISDAAKAILELTAEPVEDWIAPPDLWNRRQDTGKSVAEIFWEYGIRLRKAQNDRVAGWMDLHEWLRIVPNTETEIDGIISCPEGLGEAEGDLVPFGGASRPMEQRSLGTSAEVPCAAGWYDLHEHLRVEVDGEGKRGARMRIFRNCGNLIRTLPLLQYSQRDPNDVAGEPHELTHGPDALRYFVAGRPRAAELPKGDVSKFPWAFVEREPEGDGFYTW